MMTIPASGQGCQRGAKALHSQGAFARRGSVLPFGEQKVLTVCQVVRDAQGERQLGCRPGEVRMDPGPHGEDPWEET